MSKNEVRRVVSLQAFGGVFAEAWRGRPTRLSDRLQVSEGDVVVLAEASPDLGEKTGRVVQGSCAGTCLGSTSSTTLARGIPPARRFFLVDTLF